MTSRLITLKLPEKLIQKLDAAAEEEFASRSEFIRRCITDQLKVIEEYHARLLGAVNAIDVPSEAELLRLLRIKEGRIYAKQLRRELRKGKSDD